ncbi:MAG: urease accessory protein UreE [Actinomycetes bacterium]
MLVVDRFLGNTTEDKHLAQLVEAMSNSGAVERVLVSPTDAQRRRIRATTESGTDVGIVIDGGRALNDGDVLCHDQDESRVVVVNVAASEAMAIRLTSPPVDVASFVMGVRIGHMLGNQHWPIKVDGTVVFTPVNIDRLVMETVLRTHGVDGLEWEFLDVEPGEVPTAMPRIETSHD